MLQYSHIETNIYLLLIDRKNKLLFNIFEKNVDVDYIFLDISNELIDHPIIPIVFFLFYRLTPLIHHQ